VAFKAVILVALVGGAVAASVALAAHPRAGARYTGRGTVQIDDNESMHKSAALGLRVSRDGRRVAGARVKYRLPCVKGSWWSIFTDIPISRTGRFHQRSGGESEGGPVGEEATYISGRFIKSGKALRFHFTEQARVYTGHNDPPRGKKCARVRVNGTGHVRE
jgi:hypothetical protein